MRKTMKSSLRTHRHSEKVIGAAIEVHRTLGPGLLESVYEKCMAHELGLIGIEHEVQKALPVVYKGELIDTGFRVDLLVDKEIIVELKSVRETTPVDKAQLITYMRIAKVKFGFLINFREKLLKDGLSSFIL